MLTRILNSVAYFFRRDFQGVADLTPAQQEQLKFLLADFSAIKAEIARRSTLQRVVIVAYVAAVAFIFRQLMSTGLSRLWIVAAWAAAGLAFQFIAREGLEIERLAKIIRERIATTAAVLTGTRSEDLLPSETNPEVPNTRDSRIAYNRQFNWALFFLLPLALSVVFVVRQPEAVRAVVEGLSAAAFSGAIVVVIALWCLLLLKRHG